MLRNRIAFTPVHRHNRNKSKRQVNCVRRVPRTKFFWSVNVNEVCPCPFWWRSTATIFPFVSRRPHQRMPLSTRRYQPISPHWTVPMMMMRGKKNHLGWLAAQQQRPTKNVSICFDDADRRWHGISFVAMDLRTTLRKTTKGPISIAECDIRGNSITIENISRSKNIDLANWTLRQENEHGQAVIFVFPDSCLLRYNQSLKV